MGMILVIGAAVCLLYFIAIIIYSGIGTSFAFIWLFMSAVLFAGAGCRRYGRIAPGKIPLWMTVSALTLGGVSVLIFVIVEILIFTGVTSSAEPDLDYVIVLGAKVKRDGISKSLRMRLDRAIEYVEFNPDTVLVVSGGKGPNEPVSEAEAMRDYLIYNGIRKEQIILEDRSMSTVENIAYSRVAIEEDMARKEKEMEKDTEEDIEESRPVKIGVVTSDFHVFRAKQIAKKWGIPHIHGIAARSDIWLLPHFCVRECAAILKDKLMGNM
ncbi:YdcF family protein [Clostridium sp. AM58-1XD]|uniref:YdcF family protein n=1 Tax=Clostridium sp. AM58-1XD TaxID=2292307 RepID=UPI000E4BB050|nr:YdcF family protein [Clostridium sp. AM58-1XD]RGY97039.1 YdcF family protein [Clostridium sp. AM58-1XD]